ncbi:hypothetical protein RMSM_00170 [Rhodopirellula maiorica SM1]|uniref:Uncharacterized protein n=1 Tax=Rhodopirellula maiorica SM1 TaxID=1265738 RepID=M5RU88_9BACT|nr:hypothetical protein RMSM_00170 [Rhodopirellula maiorica SM1]
MSNLTILPPLISEGVNLQRRKEFLVVEDARMGRLHSSVYLCSRIRRDFSNGAA